MNYRKGAKNAKDFQYKKSFSWHPSRLYSEQQDIVVFQNPVGSKSHAIARHRLKKTPVK
jgi:hypothetical protein